MKITLVLPFLLGFAASQAQTTECGGPTTSSGPSLTIQFTPSMPVQTPPVSTVYGAIMTSYLNVSRNCSSHGVLLTLQVVDCNYVMVQNVDNNPAQTVSDPGV